MLKLGDGAGPRQKRDARNSRIEGGEADLDADNLVKTLARVQVTVSPGWAPLVPRGGESPRSRAGRGACRMQQRVQIGN